MCPKLFYLLIVCSVFFSKVSVFLKVTFFNVGIKDYDVIS
jgi:uncharacterized membrane protein YqaE (UPF0057 family)